jgi:DNA-binding CsgD family transcriptional regulator
MNFQPSETVSVPEQQGRPFRLFIEYKGGKTPSNFAATATAHQAGAGFSAYDKEAEQRIQFELPLDLIVIGQAFGVAGVTKVADRFEGYYSNIVRDTRTDIMRVFCRGINRPQHQGVYKDIKPQLPMGVGFQHYFIVWNVAAKEIQALQLTVGLSNHIKRAIAEAASLGGRKVRADRVNIFDLLTMENRFYYFRFQNEFIKVDKEGSDWLQGEAYFYPRVKVMTITDANQVEFLKAEGEKFQNWLSLDILKNTTAAMMPSTDTQQAPQTQQQAQQPLYEQQYKQPAQHSNAKQVDVPAPSFDDGFPTSEPFNGDLPF